MELSNEILIKLEQYLNDQMDPEARSSFESEIANSTELQEFISIYSRLDELENDAQWDLGSANSEDLKKVAQDFRSADVQAFSEKVKAFRAQSKTLASKPKRASRTLIASLVAACLALLFYFVLSGSPGMAKLYEQNSSWQELPSFTVKGDASDEQKRNIENAFKVEAYEEVVRLSEEMLVDPNNFDPALYLYKGIAHLELDEYDSALSTLRTLAESDVTDYHKALWYMALVHLKSGDREATVRALEIVAAKPSNYKAEEAKELLTKL